MATANKPYFGYEVRIHAGPPYRGITTDPERCLEEHQERLGPSAFLRIITPPLSLREARAWEDLLTRKHLPASGAALGWGSVLHSTPAQRG